MTTPTRGLVLLGVVLLGLTVLVVNVEIATRSVVWGNVSASLMWIAAMVLAIPFMSGIVWALQRWMPQAAGLEEKVAVESLSRDLAVARVSRRQSSRSVSLSR